MITAIVPARSGSKRLPGKNIKKLAGRPLFFHTIDSVLSHQEITNIIFTSDSEEYINLAKTEYGKKINYEYRPSEYAGDNIKIYEELNITCQPIAINSGYTWPKVGVKKSNTNLVVSILEPIKAGLNKEIFLEKLEKDIYTELDILG